MTIQPRNTRAANIGLDKDTREKRPRTCQPGGWTKNSLLALSGKQLSGRLINRITRCSSFCLLEAHFHKRRQANEMPDCYALISHGKIILQKKGETKQTSTVTYVC
jgi:hypothetical protein